MPSELHELRHRPAGTSCIPVAQPMAQYVIVKTVTFSADARNKLYEATIAIRFLVTKN